MEDLFNKLKTEAPINKYAREPLSYTKKNLKVNDSTVSTECENNRSCISPRRDSMPPPSSAVVIKKANKSRSLSPPKQLATCFKTKSFKVRIERKSFDGSQDISQKSLKRNNKTNSKNRTDGESKKIPKSTIKPSLDVVKTTTPTKAQQKLFDPAVLKKAQLMKEFHVKRCLVRLQRKNLEKLQKKLEIRKSSNKKMVNKDPKKLSPKESKKRKNTNAAEDDAPIRKRGRPSLLSLKEQKPKQSSFFIKLTTSPPMANAAAKLSAKMKSKKNHAREKSNKKEQSKEKLTKKIISKPPKPTTAATKFTRSQLIKAFGKRPFQSRVKIERCTHPLMIIFESNARARKLQTKRNKSKNLSVSFREQVEIFGDSDDESDTDSSKESINLLPSTSQAALNKSAIAKPLLPVMPARLKKVENGKVVDDIELDTSLFIDPTSGNSSTPYPIPARKKREKKSYSPLKDDGSPSPRKERLKMANEKMPPSGLRRLNIDDIDDDDDEDDDCEYIVPTEVPQRRISRTSSTNASDYGPDVVECVPNDVAATVQQDKDITESRIKLQRGFGEVIGNEAEDSCGSFVSAEGPLHIPPPDTLIAKESSKTKKTNVKNVSSLPNVKKADAACEGAKLSNTHTEGSVELDEADVSTRTPSPVEENCVDSNLAQHHVLPTVAPLNCLEDLMNLDIISGHAEVLYNNEVENAKEPRKHQKDCNSLTDEILTSVGNEDLSLKLYVEDDTDISVRSANFEPADSIVESFVNDTLNEFSKDIQMSELTTVSKEVEVNVSSTANIQNLTSMSKMRVE